MLVVVFCQDVGMLPTGLPRLVYHTQHGNSAQLLTSYIIHGNSRPALCHVHGTPSWILNGVDLRFLVKSLIPNMFPNSNLSTILYYRAVGTGTGGGGLKSRWISWTSENSWPFVRWLSKNNLD